MSRKYILMDKDTIEPKGEVDGSLNAIVLHRKISGVLIAAVVVLGMFLISSKSETRKISIEAQANLMSVTDSMQAIVDEANTEAEVTLLHAAIGKLSIMRGKHSYRQGTPFGTSSSPWNLGTLNTSWHRPFRRQHAA